MDYLTRSEELILLAVWKLQDAAYGASVRAYLSEITGHEWQVGAVYVPLDRMARRGYVRSFRGEPTPERGGRSKRFYRLTPAGVQALDRVRQVENALWDALPPLAFGGNA